MDNPVDKNIFEIANEVYKGEPQGAFQIRIASPEENDPNMIFEIINLIFLEGLTRKVQPLLKMINNDDVEKQTKFLENRISLMKQYIKSCCFDLLVTEVDTEEFKNFRFTKQPIFYNKKVYDFEMCFLLDIKKTKLGKKNRKTKYLYYNPYRYQDVELKDKFMILKVWNKYYKISFDFSQF